MTTSQIPEAARRGLSYLRAFVDLVGRQGVRSYDFRLSAADLVDLEAASAWIEAELRADQVRVDRARLEAERSAAGLCPRCGDADPQCICYAR